MIAGESSKLASCFEAGVQVALLPSCEAASRLTEVGRVDAVTSVNSAASEVATLQDTMTMMAVSAEKS